MKFVALLLFTIVLGGIGMQEHKIPYPQPDRDEHLMTKEIITGTLFQGATKDTLFGIAPFEKYNYPLDIRDSGKVDVYATSDGSVAIETLEKMKERLYLPIFARAESNTPLKLTNKPNVRNLRPAPQCNFRFSHWGEDPSIAHVEGFPSDVMSAGIYAYYWDGNLEGFANINTGKYNDKRGFHIHVIDKNGKVVRYQFIDFPQGVVDPTMVSFIRVASEYGTNIYVLGSTAEDNPDGMGGVINEKDVLIKIDVAKGTSSFVYAFDKTTESSGEFFTERYMVVSLKGKLVVLDKQTEKLHTIDTKNEWFDISFNPVLRSIVIRYGELTSAYDIYTFNDNGITPLVMGTTDVEKYFKYLVDWRGNLDYDYLISTPITKLQGMVKQYEGRAHHPRSMGNVESDNKFYLEKNYQRATFAGLKKDNHIRIANIDDADILPVFNNSGYDNGFYAPDRKNFIPSDFGTEYIRLWRKENAVFLVSMEYGIQGIYGFSIFLYD